MVDGKPYRNCLDFANLLLCAVVSMIPGGWGEGVGVRRCEGNDTDSERFQCRSYLLLKGWGVLWV